VLQELKVQQVLKVLLAHTVHKVQQVLKVLLAHKVLQELKVQ
jgi:hypothetical protein